MMKLTIQSVETVNALKATSARTKEAPLPFHQVLQTAKAPVPPPVPQATLRSSSPAAAQPNIDERTSQASASAKPAQNSSASGPAKAQRNSTSHQKDASQAGKHASQPASPPSTPSTLQSQAVAQAAATAQNGGPTADLASGGAGGPAQDPATALIAAQLAAVAQLGAGSATPNSVSAEGTAALDQSHSVTGQLQSATAQTFAAGTAEAAVASPAADRALGTMMSSVSGMSQNTMTQNKPTGEIGELISSGLPVPSLSDAPQPERAAATNALSGDSPVTSGRIDETVGSTQWQTALSQTTVNVVRQSMQSMELQMHPAHLGPLTISITINGDSTAVQFSAHHEFTRQAVTDSLQQLQNAFVQEGLGSPDVSVADSGGQPGQAFEQQENAGSGRATPPSQSPAERSSQPLRPLGMVDTFA